MRSMHLHSWRSGPSLGHRVRGGVATWIALAALLFQVLLPFELAAGPGAGCPGALPQAGHHGHDHHHDPGLANSHGRDWNSRHSHTGGSSSCCLRFDVAYASPFTAVTPPALPAVALQWVAFVADWRASPPSAVDAFSRPLPRAPPVTGLA